MTQNIRLGRLQFEALQLVASNNNVTFSYPHRQAPAQARAFTDRLWRLHDLGLVKDVRRTSYLTPMKTLIMLGGQPSWRATLTPAGQSLLDTTNDTEN